MFVLAILLSDLHETFRNRRYMYDLSFLKVSCNSIDSARSWSRPKHRFVWYEFHYFIEFGLQMTSTHSKSQVLAQIARWRTLLKDMILGIYKWLVEQALYAWTRRVIPAQGWSAGTWPLTRLDLLCFARFVLAILLLDLHETFRNRRYMNDLSFLNVSSNYIGSAWSWSRPNHRIGWYEFHDFRCEEVEWFAPPLFSSRRGFQVF